MTKKISRLCSLVLILSLVLSFFTIAISAETSTNPPPVMLSSAYILADADSGQILCGKDETTRVFPASTTKLVTAILAAEYYEQNQNATVTVSKETLDGIPSEASKINIRSGETLSLKDLMYALLLPSANDAAAAIAQLMDGENWKTTFPQKMNQKAAEIGAGDTNFTNPHGLHDEKHYTTVKDMSMILSYALKNKTVAEILKTETYRIEATEKSDTRNLKTSNELIIPTDTNYNPNSLGGKTGHTEEAGYCLAVACRKGGNTLIAVVMNNPDFEGRFEEANKLFSYGFDNFSKTEIPSESIPRKKVGIVSDDKLMGSASVYAESSAYVWLHNGLSLSEDVAIDVNTPENFIYSENSGYSAEATIALKEPSRYMKSELGKITLTVTSALYDSPKAYTEGENPPAEKESSGNIFKILIIILIVILLAALGVMIGCYVYANIRRKNAVRSRKNSRLESRSLNPEDRNRNSDFQIDEFDDIENTIIRSPETDKQQPPAVSKTYAAEEQLRKTEKDRLAKKINHLKEQGVLAENIQELVFNQENLNDDINDTRVLSEDIKEALRNRKEKRQNQNDDFS